ncbi:MAG: 30S ribosomal protein S6 [Bacilli bacterium]|nr:30S ribosomal protein S6 [Bacilli bacterium]
MKKYEISFIVRPDLEKEAVDKIVKELEKVLVDKKANILSSKEMGQKELAYPIKGHKTGFYYLVNIESDNKAIDEFNRVATINENILRHIIIKL